MARLGALPPWPILTREKSTTSSSMSVLPGYLETHHIKWLAAGGEDKLDNTVALCPNCHRKMHILNKQTDVKLLFKHVTSRKSQVL